MSGRRRRLELERLEALLGRIREAEKASELDAITRLFGALPEWLPEPVLFAVRLALLQLISVEKLTSAQIAQLVAEHRREERGPLIPLDVMSREWPPPPPPRYHECIRRLAEVQGALELGRSGAINRLAGTGAVLGDQTRQQRREYSVRGNQVKKPTAKTRAAKWLQIGKPLRERHPEYSNSRLALEIANKSGDNVSTIRVALAGLGLTKKKS